MLDIKRLFTKVLEAIAEGKAARTPNVLYYPTTNAPATKNTYAEAPIVGLQNWNVVAIRCRVLSVSQILIFIRGNNSESYLTYTDASGNVSRGGFQVDWTNEVLRVEWTHGSANTSIYAEGIRGIIGK